MGFYATGTPSLPRTEAGCERPRKTYLPPKNRVGVFSASTPGPARRFASQPLESHQENEPTPTTTASGMRFYGYRFLNPELGRWPNRDPIEELGGLSLYLFAGNQSVNLVDPLGLIGLGDLLQIGGSLQRVASNPLIRGSAIAGMLLSAADCLLNLAQLAQDPPDCVKTDVDQGVWIGECRDNTKDAVSSCSQLVGGIIGSIGGGAIGNLIGQIISRAAAELFNAVASDSLIDSIGGCDSPPDVDPCCGVGGNP